MRAMAKSYVSTDRDQPFLLPPDVRDWLPVQHLVWMVLEVIDGLDTTALHALHPNQGAGRKAYDFPLTRSPIIPPWLVSARARPR
jgi:hypothetical protein